MNISRLFLIFTGIALFFSCQKKVDFNFDNKPKQFVLNCTVQPDSAVRAYLSEGISPTDVINFSSITDADIQIWQSGQQIASLHEYIPASKNPGLGYYTGLFTAGITSDSLEIMVSHPDYPQLTAKTTIPPKPIISPLNVLYDTLKNSISIPGYELQTGIQFTLTDQNPSVNYYSVSMFYYADYTLADYYANNDVDTVFREKIFFELNNLGVIQTYQFNDGFIFSDDYFNGKSMDLLVKVDDILKINNTESVNFFIEIKSLSSEYYFYQKSLNEYYQTANNPFTEQVTVYNNIENGYGIFAGYNSLVLELQSGK